MSVEAKMAISDLILPCRKLFSPRPVVIYNKPTDMHGAQNTANIFCVDIMRLVQS